MSNSYYEQPDSMFCDECELCEEGTNCKCDDASHQGCDLCGRTQGCRCDAMYEAWKEERNA